MFDIGFSELLVIGLVALIVIGPEKLPRVARTVGHLIGRLQRYVADVKSDINREVELEELRKMRDSVQEAAASLENFVSAGISRAQAEIEQGLSTDLPQADALEPTTQALAGEATPVEQSAEVASKPEAPKT